MQRLMRERGRVPLLMLAAIEFCLMALAGLLGLFLSWAGWQVLDYLPQAAVFAATVTACAYACGLYNWAHISPYPDTVMRIAVALAIAFAALATIFYMLPSLHMYRSAIAFSFPLAFMTLVTARALMLKLVRRGLVRRRILVLGVGENAARLLEVERTSKARRFAFVGFIDVCREERHVDEDRILPMPNSLADLVQKLEVHEIVLAARERRGCLPLASLIECRLGGISVTKYQLFCERELGHIDHNALRPDWFLSDGFHGGPLRMKAKRAMDLVGSLILLLVTWPLIVATAVAIRIESSGSILYRQERLGLHGRAFHLNKFRSMYEDAERDGVPRWAAARDPRVTAVGKIIRAIRVDEIPQLLNVFEGDMSLVGPRPERPYFIDQISRRISFYRERHYVKPGITGWAQLNYPYGASLVDAKRKLEYDLFYIKNFGIILDLLIILQTLRIILWREGVR